MAILVDNFSGEPFEGKGERIELDYQGRTDGQPVYVGFTEPGNVETDLTWKIMFLEYDVNAQLIRRRFAVGADKKARFAFAWTDRLTLTYE